ERRGGEPGESKACCRTCPLQQNDSSRRPRFDVQERARDCRDSCDCGTEYRPQHHRPCGARRSRSSCAGYARAPVNILPYLGILVAAALEGEVVYSSAVVLVFLGKLNAFGVLIS